MKYKKSMIIIMLAIFLFAIAAASASDVNDTAIASEDDGQIGLSQSGEVKTDNLQTGEEQIVTQTDNDKNLSSSNELDVLSVDEVPYFELNSEISVGGNVELQHDYYSCSVDESPIYISGDNRIIDGKGAVIDMAGSTIQAFYVNGSGITIKNLTIKNANYNGDGGAIYFSKSGTVENCNFTNNIAANNGGAVYFNSNGNVTKCNFTNNIAANNGGAVYFNSNGNVTNCNFTHNSVKMAFDYNSGGAIYMNQGSAENCIFTDNCAYHGSAVLFNSNGTVINCNFDSNLAFSSGAVRFDGYGTVTNSNFTNNSAKSIGAIMILNGSVTNCNFTGNKATDDTGAIYMYSGSIENCNFANNTATKYGGAICMNSGTVTNCNFTNNKATGDYSEGGAIYFEYGSTGNVKNCNFTNNSASDLGGAIYFEYGSTGNVTNCNFTGNNGNKGSAIYFAWDSTTRTVSNSRFINNRANAETLEVNKNDNNITITFTGNNNLLNAIYSNGDVTFTNVAYWGANGIATTGSSPVTPTRSNKEAGQNITLEIYDYDDNLVDNVTSATDDNGQISYDLTKLNKGKYRYNAYHLEDSYYTYAEINGTFTKGQGDFNILESLINAADSVLTLDRNYTFTVGLDENLADGIIINKKITINGNGYTINANGKARIFNVRAINVVLENINFINGNAAGDGGAIYFEPAAGGSVTNCNFTNNTATGGGAIYFSSRGSVTNCNFINNTANEGGAVYFHSNGEMTNCNFTNNTATKGGAIYFSSRGSVTNCNFINNTANEGGAVYFHSNGEMTNCNFTNNTATKGGAVYFYPTGSISSVTNCNFTGNNATTGSAIYFSNMNPKPVSNSIFLNNRANAETLEVTINDNNITVTFTGNNNLLNAIYSPNEVTFTNVTYWSANGINNTGSSAIKPSRSNKEAGQKITLEIYDLNDSLVDNVTLVTDDNGQIIYDLTKLNKGKYRYNAYHPADSYYTHAESNDTFTKGPGDFNILESLINTAGSVITLDRNYTFTVGLDENLTDGILIDRPITINGNGYTINANGKSRIFNVTAENVTLNDINFINGNTTDDGGAVYFTKSGNVTNCNFANNKATGSESWGGAIFFEDGGSVENCNFTNNTAIRRSGAISFCGTGSVINCSFSDNVAYNGGPGAIEFREFGTLINSSFTNNFGNATGGAVFFINKGYVLNCNFTGNIAAHVSQGGALSIGTGSVINCRFTNNTGCEGGGLKITNGNVKNCIFTNNTAIYTGGAVFIIKTINIENCNFTGNIAPNGSAILFYYPKLADRNIVNSIFLNNRADAKTLEVTENDNNITVTFKGNNNLLNAIYSEDDIEINFTNVTYWSGDGITNTGNSTITPSQSNNEAGQSITLEIYDYADRLVDNVTSVTDDNGQISYDLTKLNKGKYKYKVYHMENNYYTYAESNGTFTVGTGDFNILQSLINAAESVLSLNRSYTFTVGLDENLTGGIVIDKPITINGNGYTINALKKARIFNVNAENVVLNNISFANATSEMGSAVYFNNDGTVENCNFTANSGDYGGAVYFNNDGTVENCNFTANTALYSGSAIYFNFVSTGTVKNSNFANNTVTKGDGGGAVMIFAGSVENCNFTDNSAPSWGSAILFVNTGNLTDCNFINNTAASGSTVNFYGNGNVKNCNFTNNTASDNGGAITFASSGTVENCNFADNSATQCGAIIFVSSGSVKNCTFTNNTATGGSGGAITFGSRGTVENCNFTLNTATARGGAISMNSGSLENCNFTLNTAADEGGAVYILKSGSVINCNFTNNSATNGDGGAINMGSGTVENCNFANNNATNNSGAVYFNDFSSVINCNFINNKATGGKSHGGAVCFNGDGSITDCDFTANSAKDGGAIDFKGQGRITNCKFTNNTASNNGGAIHIGSGSVGNCNFTNNTATHGDGGAIWTYSGSVTNCNFTKNTATNGESGAIWTYSGSVTNCNFTKNTATKGGAIWIYSGSVTNCNFTNNVASNWGGAVHFQQGGTVENSNFTDNNALYGGAVHFEEDGAVENCNFTNNTASAGGALCFSITGNVENCNFTNNTASTGGGAIIFVSTGTVSNCNFTDNTASNTGGAIRFNGNGAVENCNFTGNDATTGSAIYFDSSSDAKTVSNSNFLNNMANAKDLQVTKNDNNITITFTGNDNLLNAIYSEGDVNFTNVTYWSADGIKNTGSSSIKPTRSNKEAGQNITVSAVINDILVLNEVKVTDENGAIVLDISAGENYYISARHDADSYYTEAVKTITTMKFNVNVTSQTTTNRTVNITAKSNIYSEVMPGQLLFIVPDTAINATYAGNGTWWAAHTFDDYAVYNINATYSGLDNVTVSNATITINKANSTLTVGDIEFDFNSSGSATVSFTGATGVNASVVGHNEAVVNVDGNTITVSGLNAGNYTLTVTTITDANHNNVTKTATITVNKINSTLTVENIISDYNSTGSAAISYGGATGVNASVVNHLEAVVNVDGNTITVSGLNAGNYTLTVTTITDANHNNVTKTATITVNKINSTLTVENIISDYNSTGSAAISYSGASGVNASVVNHPEAVVNVNTDSITVSGLNAGNYTLTVTTIADANHNNITKTAKITVNKVDSTLTVGNVIFDYNTTGSAAVSFTGATGVNASVVNHPEAVVNVKENTITVSGLNAGNYTLTVATIADANHNNITKTANITVNKVDSTLTVGNVIFDYGSSDSAAVSFTGATGVNASVVNHPEATVNVNTDSITVSGLNAGNYTLTVATIADANHNSVTKTANVTVNKIDSTLTVGDIVFDYNSTGSTSLSFTGATGVNASVVSHPEAVVNVTTDSITVSGLNAGNYTLTVTTIADANHNSVTKTAAITVNKIKTELTANAITTTYNIDKELVITLKDSNGNALSGVNVTVDLNGAKEYTTDENGQVKVSTRGLAPQTYTANITFNGTDIYDKSVKDVNVTVKKATPKITAKAKTFKTTTKTKKYTITLKDNTGKAIKNAKVTLKVNGKTYKATTNSKGKATFKITKLNRKGTYKATVTYKENKYYNKATKKAKITVKSVWKTVSKGCKDKNTVKKIQKALKANGYYLSYKGHYLMVDGIFESCTERSVKEFQHDKGLKVTGKVDEKTAKKLKII